MTSVRFAYRDIRYQRLPLRSTYEPMLPFLNRRNSDVAQSAPSAPVQREPDETGDEGLKACAQELLNAVYGQDVEAAATAPRSAFELLDRTR